MHAPSPFPSPSSSPWPSPARVALTPDGVIEGYASLFGEIDQARGWTSLASQNVTGITGAADAPAPVARRGSKASGPMQACSLRSRAGRKMALGKIGCAAALRGATRERL